MTRVQIDLVASVERRTTGRETEKDIQEKERKSTRKKSNLLALPEDVLDEHLSKSIIYLN